MEHSCEIDAQVVYDGNDVNLVFHTGTKVGAIPLLSPTSGKPDYGLVIKPRFGWPGIGPMLGEMGWRVIPTPLKIPLLPTSDKKIPAWVLSTMILFRIKSLLERLERRFEFSEGNLTAPRGQINWPVYVQQRMAIAQTTIRTFNGCLVKRPFKNRNLSRWFTGCAVDSGRQGLGRFR